LRKRMPSRSPPQGWKMSNPQLPAVAPELASLLPSSIGNDALMRDMARAMQPALNAAQQVVEVPALYARIDTMPEAELRLLAWENRMLGAEWTLAQTLEDKRSLVKNAYQLNRMRGTRWAVERVFDLLRLHAVILEWWEELPRAAPFTFRIAVLDVGGRGILASELALVDELIEAYKPLTRHNTGINLQSTTTGTYYVGGCVSFTTRLQVEPARVGDVDVGRSVPAGGVVAVVARLEVGR
jgi:phage tail P2-like protein